MSAGPRTPPESDDAGALIGVGVMATQLLLMALALALALLDGRRLLGVLLLNRATEPRVPIEQTIEDIGYEAEPGQAVVVASD